MPALWQSSQRPMYVKTIWVDGFRHAILSPDDPYLLRLNGRNKRPYSSATCSSHQRLTPSRSSRLSHTSSDLDDLEKFNFVVTNDRSFSYQKQRPKSSYEADVEKLNLTDLDQDSEEELIVKANTLPVNEFDSSRTRFEDPKTNMKTLRSNRTSRADVKENTELSERVLQWLDLAGKIDLLAPDKGERLSHPRHSWPEIQRKNHHLSKSKTAVDIREKDSYKVLSPKAGDTAKPPQSGTIDRHEIYMPTSANTIENYARQSRNARNTPRNETTIQTKDNLNKKRVKDFRSVLKEARQKIACERNALEKQYADLLSKKLIPDNLKSKKQVHIFMPELPKKIGSSNATSRTESLLSQFSHVNKKTKQ